MAYLKIKTYLKINGKVSKDKWQSMFRYFAKYLRTHRKNAPSRYTFPEPSLFIRVAGGNKALFGTHVSTQFRAKKSKL